MVGALAQVTSTRVEYNGGPVVAGYRYVATPVQASMGWEIPTAFLSTADDGIEYVARFDIRPSAAPSTARKLVASDPAHLITTDDADEAPASFFLLMPGQSYDVFWTRIGTDLSVRVREVRDGVAREAAFTAAQRAQDALDASSAPDFDETARDLAAAAQTRADAAHALASSVSPAALMTGATGAAAGTGGLVPAPAAGTQFRALLGSGLFGTPGRGLVNYATNDGPTFVASAESIVAILNPPTNCIVYLPPLSAIQPGTQVGIAIVSSPSNGVLRVQSTPEPNAPIINHDFSGATEGLGTFVDLTPIRSGEFLTFTAYSLFGSIAWHVSRAGSPRKRVSVYSAPGSGQPFAYRSWTKRVEFVAVAGGNAGGSGATNANNSNAGGGGGAGGGSVLIGEIPISSLTGGATTVTVGAGGVGGAATSGAPIANGNAGAVGGLSEIVLPSGRTLRAVPAGTAGGPGTTSAAGAAGTTSTLRGVFLQVSSGFGQTQSSGGIGGITSPQPGTQPILGPGGAGGGAGISTSNVIDFGAAGAPGSGLGLTFAEGAAVTTNAGLGTDGGAQSSTSRDGLSAPTARLPSQLYLFGHGGRGGNSLLNAPGQSGGKGGWPGGGGGGGGASRSGFASGAGGNGGDGCVIIIEHE